MLMNSTEEQLIQIQKSTRTTLPFFIPIHNFFRMRLKWYYNWHLWHHSSRAHVAVLASTILGICLGLFSLTNNVVQPPLTSAAVWDNWIVAGAGDSHYNQTYLYAGSHNGADYYRVNVNDQSYYLFRATNAVGTITWRLNDELQADLTAPITADYWTVSDTLPGSSWNFDPTKPEISPAPTSVTAGSTDGILAGTIYTNSGELTPIGAGKTVALSINGGVKVTTETDSNGQFWFTGQTYGAGSVISIFLDDETEKASNIFTSQNSSAITGLVLIQDNIKIASQNSSTITNVILDTADNVADTDLGVSISTNNATFADGQQLWVRYEKTYNPGGAVNCHDLRVNGTLAMGVNALSISGSATTVGTATGLITTSTITTFTSTAAETINLTGSSLRTVDFNGVGGEWTISGTLSVGYIHAKHGTIKGTADVAVDSGDVSSSSGEDGIINMSGGTFTVYSNGIMDNRVPWVFHNLTLGNGTDGAVSNKQTSANVTIEGNLTIASTHTYQTSGGGNVILKGNFVNNGSLTAGTSTFILSGTAQQNISTATFYNLTVQNATAEGVVFDGDLTTSGTFTNVTASSKLTFNSGSAYNFNAININGGNTSTRITLTSSASGVPWNINITAVTPSASYVSVKDSVANKEVDARTGGLDSGGNTLWLFPPTKTVSGIVYSDNNKTGNIGAGKTIALSLNGGAATTVETGEGGTYSFADVAIPQNGVIAMFISGETEKGSIIFRTGMIDISYIGIEWYVGNVKPSFRNESEHTEITNSELDVADNVGDSDLGVSASGGTATFADGLILYVWNNKTYRPGGAVVADNVEVDGTFNMEGNPLTVSSNLLNEGILMSTGNITFDATVAGKNITSGGSSLGNITFNGVGGEWTLQDNINVNSLRIMNGNLIDNGRTVTVSGNILIDAVENILASTGTWIQSSSGDLANYYPSNKFNILQVNSSVHSTRVNSVCSKKLIMGAGSVMDGDFLMDIYQATTNDFIDIGEGADITENELRATSPQDGLTQKAFTISADFSVGYGISKTLFMSGDWVAGSFRIYGSASSDSEAEAMVLDTSGYNLASTGDLILGLSQEAYPSGYQGKVLLRDGTHVFAGSLDVSEDDEYSWGYFDFASADISVGGSFNLSRATLTDETSSLSFTATSAGKNITSNNHDLPDIEFNGVGGEWTLQDNLLTSDIHLMNGRLFDNGKTVTVGGDIIVDRVENVLTSTGTWIQASSGNLYNSSLGSGSFPNTWFANKFKHLIIDANVTSNLTGDVYVEKITLRENAVVRKSDDLWGISIHWPADDFITMAEGSSFSGGRIRVNPDPIRPVTYHKALSISIPIAMYLTAITDSAKLSLTGDWQTGGLLVYGRLNGNTEATAAVLDTSGHNLTVNGDVSLGWGTDQYLNGYYGKLVLGSGNHTVTGSISVPQNNHGTRGFLDLGSSTLHLGGDFNTKSLSITKGTSTFILNGSGSQAFSNIDSVAFNNIKIENASSGGVSFSGNTTVSGTFTNITPNSKMIFGSESVNLFSAIDINGGSSDSRIFISASSPGNQWNLNVASQAPTVSYVTVSDSNASGGNQIIANDGTNIDSGNNTNWLFGNYQAEIATVAITPSFINLNPGKSVRFSAKAYNVLGQEVTSNFEWTSTSAGSITNQGLFTAGSATGSFKEAVTVTASGKSAKADVNIVKETPYIVPGWIIISPDSKILKPKEEYKFEGKVYDTSGLLIENASPEWRLADGGGEITADGLFIAGENEGIFVNTIVASYADVRSYATVVVRGDTPIEDKNDETVISEIIKAGTSVLEIAKNIAKNDSAKEAALVVTAVATASAGISGMLGLASAQMGIKEYLLFIINYFMSLRAAKRKNKFGIVFDESTQRPVQGAMVRLFDFKTMRLVSTAITDKNGSYIFIVQPGEYVMSVVKPGFAFPSNMIRISQNLVDNYIGQTIAVDNYHPVINQKIPVDPSSNQQIRLGLLFRLLNSIYFRPVVLVLGSTMTVYALSLVPSTLNFIVAGGFVLLWLAEAFIQNRNVKFSKVLDKTTGKPISLALVRVLSSENKLLETFISDQYGRVLPKTITPNDQIIVEKNGYVKLTEQANASGLVERKKYNLYKNS